MSGGGVLRLRVAKRADADLLLGWANDPEDRRWSLDPSRIPRREHLDWLDRTLGSREAAAYVGEIDGKPVGYAWLKPVEDGHEVAITIDGEHRGGGCGRELLRLTCRRATQELGARRILARVREGNLASLRAFEAAGFRRQGIGESKVVRLAWEAGGEREGWAGDGEGARR